MQNIHLIAIDPQNSFAHPKGSLFCPGADTCMDNLARMIDRLGPKLTKISVTLDQHHEIDISHPQWWKDSAGNHPDPIVTTITAADMKTGKWTTTNLKAYARTLKYLETLEATKRYPHTIWPPHCLIGTTGAVMYENFAEAVNNWSTTNLRNYTRVSKGSNIWTEHFSAIQAEVPDPKDPSTQVNVGFVRTVEQADIILLTGLARSHCLANTGYDIFNNFSDPAFAAKLVLLEDSTVDVPGCEALGEKFVRFMTAKGMQRTTTTEFLRAA